MECERFYTVLSVYRAALIRRLLLWCMAPGSDTQPGRKLPVAAPGRAASYRASRAVALRLSIISLCTGSFLFCFLHGGQRSCRCDTNGTGKKGDFTPSLSQAADRLGFRGPWLTLMLRIVCPVFFFSWLIACCVADGNSKASVDVTFGHFFPTVAKKHT